MEENKNNKDIYTGEIPIKIDLDCPSKTKVPCKVDVSSDWYYTTDIINGEYDVYRELRLYKIIFEKERFMTSKISIELTRLGEGFITDLVSLCEKDGIELEFYLSAKGSYHSGKEKHVTYDRIKFGDKFKPKCRLEWSLRADYTVR